mgnify:CR=1 FL=1
MLLQTAKGNTFIFLKNTSIVKNFLIALTLMEKEKRVLKGLENELFQRKGLF